MKHIRQITTLGLLASLAGLAVAPASADNHQGQKNTGRNIGIGGAALLGYGLLKHNSTAAILGGVGAVAGAKMYEDNRKAQSRNNARRHYYHHGRRYYHSY